MHVNLSQLQIHYNYIYIVTYSFIAIVHDSIQMLLFQQVHLLGSLR